MDLYFSPISPYSHKVRMTFFEKNLAFNPVPVNLADVQVRAEYREVFPLGKLPVLKTANEMISESSNIVEWLDNHYQVNKLLPEKAEEARKVRYWDRMADLYITANAISLFFQGLKPEAQQDVDAMETARQQLATVYDMFEHELANEPGEWCVGNRLSLADISLAVGLAVSQGVMPLTHHSTLANLFHRAQQRETFGRAREGFEQAVTAMVKARTQS